MTFSPSLDVWVWIAAVAFLALLGARAWVVETSRTSLRRTTARVRLLTFATTAALVALGALVGVQGGAQLVSDVILAKRNPAAYQLEVQRRWELQNPQPAPAPAPAAPAPAAPAGPAR